MLITRQPKHDVSVHYPCLAAWNYLQDVRYVPSHQWNWFMCHSVFRPQDSATYHCVFRSIGVIAPYAIICTYRTISKTTFKSASVAGERAGAWREMQGSRPRGPVVLLQLLLTKSRPSERVLYALTINSEFCVCRQSLHNTYLVPIIYA